MTEEEREENARREKLWLGFLRAAHISISLVKEGLRNEEEATVIIKMLNKFNNNEEVKIIVELLNEHFDRMSALATIPPPAAPPDDPEIIVVSSRRPNDSDRSADDTILLEE